MSKENGVIRTIVFIDYVPATQELGDRRENVYTNHNILIISFAKQSESDY